MRFRVSLGLGLGLVQSRATVKVRNSVSVGHHHGAIVEGAHAVQLLKGVGKYEHYVMIKNSFITKACPTCT